MLYKNDYEKLATNVNTGIRYEFAVAYMFMGKQQQTEFLNEVINIHPQTDKIMDSINLMDESISLLVAQWKNLPNYYVSLMATQNDLLGGPSDVLICNGDKIIHGFSVKYNNHNTYSPSGKKFLTIESIKDIYKEYSKVLPSYLVEMDVKRGKCMYLPNSKYTTWDRTRDVDTVDNFIDFIRDKVIIDWDNKPLEEKIEILKAGYHANTTIDCSIITISSNGKKFKHQPMQMLPEDITDITMEKYGKSRINFLVNEVPMAYVQPKPNSGFINRAGKKNPFIVGDNVEYGEASFDTSWNFGVIHVNINI